MNTDNPIHGPSDRTHDSVVPTTASEADRDPDFRLSRWLVYFASGSEWWRVGEFVATDANSAIARAVEVFGGASEYRAEQIPWDTAPLWRPGK